MGEPDHGGSASALPSLSAPPLVVTFHPGLEFTHSIFHGAGLYTTESIAPHTPLVRVPFPTTLSILSIPYVDPPWPSSFYRKYADSPEILTRFLLCELRVRGPESKWWPYISLLPQDFDTPLYWKEEDREWLRGTNLLGATRIREQQWQSEWSTSMQLLAESCPDPLRRYPWENYKWAATVLSSRSFSQKVVKGYTQPFESESEIAKSSLAQRWLRGDQDLLFPVLLPGLDLGNHNPKAKARWIVEDEAVVFTREEEVQVDTEVFNNYGSKGTEELLLGYGFMLEDNDADFVMLSTTSAGAPTEMSQNVQEPSQLSSCGRLYAPLAEDDTDRPDRVLQRSLLPNDILKLASQIVNERELMQVRPALPEMSIVPQVHTRRLNLMVDGLISSMEDRRDRLEESEMEAEPSNHRQQMATQYREAQVDILSANIDFLSDYLLSLQSKGRILLLSSLLTDSAHPAVTSPLLSILTDVCGSKPKAKTVRLRGAHELAFTLWICSIWLEFDSGSLKEDDNLFSWIRFITRAYSSPALAGSTQLQSIRSENESTIESYLELVKCHGDKNPEGLYADKRWSADLIAWSLRVWREESIVLKSLDRFVQNGTNEEHEDMLFMEK